MADFSNVRSVRWTAEGVGALLEKDVPISDRMFLEAVDQLSPALLPASLMAALRRELDERAPHRGRPKTGAPKKILLADQVARVKRADVPIIFRDRLAKRLRSKRRFTELERGAPGHRLSMKRRRDTAIYAVYYAILELLNGSPEIDHPILGRLAVPAGDRPKHEQALLMTQGLLQGFTELAIPSLRTLMNIISENRP